MKNYFLSFIFFLSFCMPFLSFAQESKIDSLESILKTSQEDTVKVNALNALSRELRNTGNYPGSKQYALQAEQLSKNANFLKGETMALNNIGLIYDFQGDYPAALEYYLKALKVAKAANDKKGIARAFNNIGIIYNYQGESEKALEHYYEALKIMEEIGDKRGMSMALTNVGIIYKNQKNYEKALDYYSKSLKIRESIGDKNIIAASYANIGNLYDNMKDYPKAMEYQLKSLKIREETSDKKGIAGCFINMSKIFAEQKKYNEAAEYANKSLKLSNELGVLELVRESHLSLSEIYMQMGNCDRSFIHYKNYVSVRDSIFNNENTEKTIREEMNFEFEKKQQEEMLEQTKREMLHMAEVKNQRIVIYAVTFGFLLVFIFSLIVFKNYRQKQSVNKLLNEKNSIIEERNKNITDSIIYAKRIQQAILPTNETIRKSLPDSFIFYKPKDIVSGDFYWLDEWGGKILFAVVDCTGHGVPGALMSMVGHNLISQALNEHGLSKPNLILNALNKGISKTLHQKQEAGTVRDGMDITLCSLDKSTNVLELASANHVLYHFRANKLTIHKGDKISIGENKPDNFSSFTNHEINLQKGDTIYIFTDGYADQFGGSKNKKFMLRQFRKMLGEIQDMTMKEQEEKLRTTIERWQGGNEQVDDILVMGIKI
jgi:serine phosphatase RsbU (regulator of sigma subunit)/Tfp pilus assembly protein PilF